MITNLTLNDKNFELFLESETIAKRIRLMGIQLNVDYENRCPIFVGVLNGCFLFMADLIKQIEGSCETVFIKVSSYAGTESLGKVREIIGLPQNLAGRDIILVEDIIDTGHTLNYILDELKSKNPTSIAVCSLLLKPQAVQYQFDVKQYIGFEIPNDFVLGYGLDYDGIGRNLTNIYRAK